MHTDHLPQIAITAMSGVFPKAVGIDQFWQNIVHAVDAIDYIPEHRIDGMADRFNATPQSDHAYSSRAGIICETDFNLPPDSPGMKLDFPSQWVLYAGRQAYQQGRLHGLDQRRIAVISAAIALPTRSSSILSELFLKKALAETFKTNIVPKDLPVAPDHRVVAFPAALIAQALGLGGGSYTLDAACASSLYAVKLACDQLQSYRSDAVITGGFSGADTLYTQIGFSQLKALSPSGRCAPFDHRADGLVVGEGVGILVLRRLDDALKDGNTIYGIIHGIGLSNDMRGNLLAPESAGQIRAMQNAYAQAGWLPTDVDYIECHGAGTPVGDITELKSLVQLWGNGSCEPVRCALGSVKSMIGHLLTGAGAAGMIKTLLGLHHKILPPTLNFERPPEHSPLLSSPFRVQTRTDEWKKRKTDIPRRAAVSAFGFGGINAHILLEEWDEETYHTPAKAATRHRSPANKDAALLKNKSQSAAGQEIAIIGMDVYLAGFDGLPAFERGVFNTTSGLCEKEESRCNTDPASGRTGGFIDEIVIAPGEFQIPPNEIPDILPQQLLMLKTALRAMKNAGLAPREPRERMGAVIGISFDYEATNFHQRWRLPRLVAELAGPSQAANLSSEAWSVWFDQAQNSVQPPLTSSRTLGALGGMVASRIAREFRFGGPSFVVSAEEITGLRALEIAIGLLTSNECDAVLVGAVDMQCDERNLATIAAKLPLSPSGQVRPFDEAADGTLPGEGAVALVLKRLSDARTHKDRVFAVIEGIGSASHNADGETAYLRSLQSVFRSGTRSPAGIGLMECHGSGIRQQDDLEARNLSGFFAPYIIDQRDAIAIGALKPLVGHTGAASGLASVAKTALSLYHQLLPPLPGFTATRPNTWPKGKFFFPRRATYWSRDRVDGVRAACTAAMTPDGDCMHALLSESPDQEAAAAVKRPRRATGALPCGLFILQGGTENELIDQLAELSRLNESANTKNEDALDSLSRQWHDRRQRVQTGRLFLSILTPSPSDLADFLIEAKRVVEKKQRSTINGRGGVCYFPDFSIDKHQIAFVFPGSGNHYVGMGRSLGVHWLEVLQQMDADTDRLHSQLLPRWYDPWRIDWRKGWQTEAYQELIADPLRTIFGQVLFGSQMTTLLQHFNIGPDAVIGYSLGESAALFATGAWPDRGLMLDRLSASNLFKTQLAGAYSAVRQAWHLPQDLPVHWRAAVVNRPAAEVDQTIGSLDFVRRLIVNTPEECVIGGLASAVAEAVRRLGCDVFFLDGVVAVHCDAAMPVAQAYRDLHVFDTSAVPGVRFYSVARGTAYPLTSEAAADSILSQALTGFDFPRCIEQAYQDGIRLFLEIGPHNSCTRMISRILADRPHLAVAANQRNEDEVFALLKCLAALAAAGVALNPDPLFAAGGSVHAASEASFDNERIRVPIGRKALHLPDPPPFVEKPPPQAVSDSHPMVEPSVIFRTGQTESAAVLTSDSTDSSPRPTITMLEELMAELNANMAATARAHEQFLSLMQEMTTQFSQTCSFQNQLISSLSTVRNTPAPAVPIPLSKQSIAKAAGPPLYDRSQCLEFAVGSAARVLGLEFAVIDSYKARVRLPDEPLMLVDRILQVEGQKGRLGPGRVVTEHDVINNAWYLDGGRAPVCISVEAGQADLFLSAYLGIDHLVQGQRTYRLLDATIAFHRSLPMPGETIRYDIHIDKFVKQGATYLFFFRFKGFIGSQALITMTNGCAGFFTEQEVQDSGGIILTEEDRKPGPEIKGHAYTTLIPLPDDVAFDDRQVDALRRGNAAACFGPLFAGIALPPSLRLPSGRMRLIQRIVTLQPQGGRFGRGYIKAEADIDPEAWFLNCHFIDDKVMPGTLMYECCAHALRVLLLQLGWVTSRNDVFYEPLQGVPCRLKCRGPVTPATRRVHYAVEIKEIGYAPQPYVIADAHMYADDHYIVFFKDMSMQLSGLSGEEIRNFWHSRPIPEAATATSIRRPALPGFDRRHIVEFAVGAPSKAFGELYRPFDRNRVMARLPGPPFSFIDRIVAVDHPAWQLKPSGWVEAQYDVPLDAWYFAADRCGHMPFSVLMEVALQPCGWLAAYSGSALKSKQDLKFRNLDGRADQQTCVIPTEGTLTIRTRLTKVSEAADMIIENFVFEVLGDRGMIFSGTTNFGFFTSRSLANQVGMPHAGFAAADDGSQRQEYFEDHPPLEPDQAAVGLIFKPTGLAMPAKALRMIDRIDLFDPVGGPNGLGYVRGSKTVDAQEWFYKAHFYQDPVCPGSLGIEAFLQLIKYAALRKWPELSASHLFAPLTNQMIQWQYRGQITPQNREMTVEAVITRATDRPEPMLMADGWLFVDGLCIYHMKQFGLRLQTLPD